LSRFLTITFSPSIASFTMSCLGGSIIVSLNGTIGSETFMAMQQYLQVTAQVYQYTMAVR